MLIKKTVKILKSGENYTTRLNNSEKPFKTFTAALETLQKCRTSKIITFTITLLSDYVYDVSANGRIKLFHPDCQLGRMYIKYPWLLSKWRGGKTYRLYKFLY